jgi:branched-chain amino acid transport system permease protein
MSLDISILIALMAMLGGAGSLWGPIIGAGILIPLKSYLKEWLGGQAGLAGMDLVIYAVIIMLISARSPGRVGHRRTVRPKEGNLMPLLEVKNLVKDFGGLRANDDISFQLERANCWG